MTEGNDRAVFDIDGGTFEGHGFAVISPPRAMIG
jgi:hypothetical protein